MPPFPAFSSELHCVCVLLFCVCFPSVCRDLTKVNNLIIVTFEVTRGGLSCFMFKSSVFFLIFKQYFVVMEIISE